MGGRGPEVVAALGRQAAVGVHKRAAGSRHVAGLNARLLVDVEVDEQIGVRTDLLHSTRLKLARRR